MALIGKCARSDDQFLRSHIDKLEYSVCLSVVKSCHPPPTTKAAIFYKGGYEAQLLFNVNGYAFSEKCDLFEKQFKTFLGEEALKQLDICEYQRYE